MFVNNTVRTGRYNLGMNEIAQPTAVVYAIVVRTHVLQILEGPFHIISKYFWMS